MVGCTEVYVFALLCFEAGKSRRKRFGTKSFVYSYNALLLVLHDWGVRGKDENGG